MTPMLNDSYAHRIRLPQSMVQLLRENAHDEQTCSSPAQLQQAEADFKPLPFDADRRDGRCK